jgi:predicted transcriptional regulator
MGEPKLWVHSAQRLGKLIDENWPLLQEIRRRPPRSMSELAGRTGRSLSNLSRTLKIFGALRAGIDRVR